MIPETKNPESIIIEITITGPAMMSKILDDRISPTPSIAIPARRAMLTGLVLS